MPKNTIILLNRKTSQFFAILSKSKDSVVLVARVEISGDGQRPTFPISVTLDCVYPENESTAKIKKDTIISGKNPTTASNYDSACVNIFYCFSSNIEPRDQFQNI